MPFIRLNSFNQASVIDVNVRTILTFSALPGDKYTTVCLRDNLNLQVTDTPRSIRGYIKKAEGLLPEKEEAPKEANADATVQAVIAPSGL